MYKHSHFSIIELYLSLFAMSFCGTAQMWREITNIRLDVSSFLNQWILHLSFGGIAEHQLSAIQYSGMYTHVTPINL